MPGEKPRSYAIIGFEISGPVLRWSGGHSGGIPPDPIPNSAVKAPSAYGTACQHAGESVVARPAKNGFCNTLKTIPPSHEIKKPRAHARGFLILLTRAAPAAGLLCTTWISPNPAPQRGHFWKRNWGRDWKCQRRRQNASVRRSKDASVRLAGRPPAGGLPAFRDQVWLASSGALRERRLLCFSL